MRKREYEERKARVDAGEGSDEDRRLVKLYERDHAAKDAPSDDPGGEDVSAGSSTPPSVDPPQTNASSSSGSRRSRARTTENP